MEWIEMCITTKSEGVEIVSGSLINLGIQGLIIEDDKELQNFLNSPLKYWDYVDDNLINKNREDAFIKLYLSDNVSGQEMLINIKNNLDFLKKMDFGFNLGSLSYTLTNVDDEDWLNSWKKHYTTFTIGKKIVIKPIWEDYENKENKIVFNIEPGHAFGTGLHQTTQLCILSLEKYVTTNSCILDLGCGTGILSIISMLLGGKNSLAIDIDPNAVDTALKNAKTNNVLNNYEAYSGDVLVDIELQNKINLKKYNVVVINIVADVIIGLLDFVKKVLTKDGVLILSGIINERAFDVESSLLENSFKIISTNEKEGWTSITASK